MWGIGFLVTVRMLTILLLWVLLSNNFFHHMMRENQIYSSIFQALQPQKLFILSSLQGGM